MQAARFPLRVALATLALFAPTAQAAEPNLPQPKVTFRPTPAAIRTHCFDCHDQFSAEAELNLEDLDPTTGDVFCVAGTLEKIHRAVADGSMPPADAASRPSPAERKAILAWVDGTLDALAKQYSGDPGPVIMPRLTAYEYRNVMRDLSGGVVTSAGQYLPQEGGAGEGFANVGQAQGMSAAQLEKYLDAADAALRYLRVDPKLGFIWEPISREPVDDPRLARKELTDAIIAWYVGQQQKWGQEHREALNEKFGFIHAAYLEAAWRYRYRKTPTAPLAEFAVIDGVPLAPAALTKWWAILNDPSSDSPFAAWATAWRKLPGAEKLTSEELRLRCVAITTGQAPTAEPQDYAPPYEVSFHEARDEVLKAAHEERRWPFRIAVGEATELYLVATDAGDGSRGEYAVWQQGRFVFENGETKPWQEVVTVLGANSGRAYKWGVDGEGKAQLPPDTIGVRPPGALKFKVPAGATIFEVELSLDPNRTQEASIQALVLTDKPKSQSYVPGRTVFGGKKRMVAAADDNKAQRRALRLRNVAEAKRPKIGLNAERNVFARWEHTSLELIGGPWPNHEPDQHEPQAPYHYTVEEVLQNATADDLQTLTQLEGRLLRITQPTQQRIVALGRAEGWETAAEGILPPEEEIANWSEVGQRELAELRKRLVHEEIQLAARAGELLSEFATRAWRRPLTAEEQALLVGLYRDSRARGTGFDSAMKSALLVVLISPHFLYHGSLSSPSDAEASDDVIPLDDWALASRLSFFLWGSLPDQELLDLAAQGRLTDPEVLRMQARRMVKHDRARSLATDFAGQLWGFADFTNHRGPDEERFPEFSEELRQAMYDEVVLWLDDLFRNDRPLTDLIDSRRTFANKLLVDHYGLESVAGEEFQPVELAAHHRGLAGKALFLTKTSLPLRTSPVQRGVWLLEQVLGEELPNPPADVPPLSNDETNAAGEGIRVQLQRHRAQASCASCHNKIDPLGIALENYDAIGRWREHERDGQPIESTAVSAEGMPLAGEAGLQKYLRTRQQEVFRHFNRKLLGYALGRAVGPGDYHLLDQMQNDLVDHDYRFTVLVESIVTSRQFMMRRADP